MEEHLLPPPRHSWRQLIATLPPGEQEDLTATLLEADIQSLVGDWFLDARREQIEPPGDWWFIWFIMAGRGFGKNWAGSNWLIDQHRINGAQNSGIVAATSSDLRRYCIEGPSGILSVAPNDWRPQYQPSKTRLLWPNGTTTQLFTSEEPERLRGPNLDKAWCDEIGSWKNPEAVLDMLFLTLRLGEQPRCMMTSTPRPIPAVRALLAREDKDVIVTRGSTMDNRGNLAKSFVSKIIEQYKGTRLERQEIYGEMLDDFEGALWNHGMFDEAGFRTSTPNEMSRVVIGVDPPTTHKGVCGIVAAGRTVDKRGFVLGDHSASGSPESWASKVVGAYYAHNADAVVAEVNQGGDMVESTIHNIDSTIPIIKVRAAQGKVARAEPVAMIYEQSRIKHCGLFPALEDEMCVMVPGELKESPNRVDALVWAFHELLVTHKRGFAGTFGRRRNSRLAQIRDKIISQTTKTVTVRNHFPAS